MILDYIDNLELPDDEVDNHFDARMTLARLGEGLFWLHREVGKLEVQARKEAAKDNTLIQLVGGSVLNDKTAGLLSCAFQWYAISACNYVQLAGWLAKRNTKFAKDYMKRVLPRLLNYRNKVAAHFAITEPYTEDNEADLAASIMTNIIYAHGRLFAAALTPVVVGNGKQEIQVSRDLSWSLTLAHEKLVKRYWTNGEPKSYQAIRVPPGEITLNISWSDLTGTGT